MNNIIINSERLFLRPLSLSELIEIADGELRVSTNDIDPCALIPEAKSAISKKIEKMKSIDNSLHELYTYWLICDKTDNKGIGLIGFKGTLDQKGYIEIGYSISTNYRRKGLMSEALKAITNWIKSYDCDIKPNGIIANVLNTNIGSMKVLENCGFQSIESNEKETIFVFDF
jgi:RimJ/RimL family protein N-acetyltransferase